MKKEARRNWRFIWKYMKLLVESSVAESRKLECRMGKKRGKDQ